jgi:hypothetical protein
MSKPKPLEQLLKEKEHYICILPDAKTKGKEVLRYHIRKLCHQIDDRLWGATVANEQDDRKLPIIERATDVRLPPMLSRVAGVKGIGSNSLSRC